MLIANKYKIIENINCGTFGALYKAKNMRTNEIVAIKIEKKIIINTYFDFYFGNLGLLLF